MTRYAKHTLRSAVALITVLFVPFLMGGFRVAATERTLGKYHRSIVFGDVLLAKFTVITTLDELSPYLAKYLYEDPSGRRLVILRTDPASGPHTITVKLVSSGETLTVVQQADNSSTITLGSAAPIVVQESDIGVNALPQSFKNQGQQSLSTVSLDFQQALKNLAEVGSQHSPTFDFIGAILNGLCFPEFEGKLPRVDRAGPTTGAVKNFDPNTHPPGQFELAFGDEYFHLP